MTLEPHPALPHLDIGPLSRPEVGPRSASEYLWDMSDVAIDESIKSTESIGDIEVGAAAAKRGEGGRSSFARKGKRKSALFAFLPAALSIALVMYFALFPGGGDEPNAAGPGSGPGDAAPSTEIPMLPSEAGPGSGSGDMKPSMEILMPPSGDDEPSSAQLGSGSGDAKPSTEILISNIGDEEGQDQIAEDASRGTITSTVEGSSKGYSEESSEDVEPDEAPESNRDNDEGGRPPVPGGHVPSAALENYDGSDIIDTRAQWHARSIPSYGIGSESGDAKPSAEILLGNVGDEGHEEITEDASPGAIASTSEGASKDSVEDTNEDTSEDVEPEEVPGIKRSKDSVEDTNEDTSEDVEPEEIPGIRRDNGGGDQPLVPGGHVPSGALHNYDGTNIIDLQAQWHMRSIPSHLGSESADVKPSTEIFVSNVGDEGHQKIKESSSQGSITSKDASEDSSEDSSEYTPEDVEPKEMPGSNRDTGGGVQPLDPGGYVPINGSDEGDLEALWDMRIIP